VIVRLVVAAAVVAVVFVVAVVVRKRSRPEPPPRTAYPIPRQLDRTDFPDPGKATLVAYFWSRTCDSCVGLGPKLAVLADADTALAAFEETDDRAMHRRYDIAAIPMILVADTDGVVRRAFVGAVSSEDLWSAVAAIRSPGSVPDTGAGVLED